MSDVRKDAQGQFAPSQGDRKATGVARAKPTGSPSEDATAYKTRPGDKPVKEWDVNHDPSSSNEGDMR